MFFFEKLFEKKAICIFCGKKKRISKNSKSIENLDSFSQGREIKSLSNSVFEGFRFFWVNGKAKNGLICDKCINELLANNDIRIDMECRRAKIFIDL